MCLDLDEPFVGPTKNMINKTNVQRTSRGFDLLAILEREIEKKKKEERERGKFKG